MSADSKVVMRFQRQIIACLSADDASLNRAAFDVLALTANPHNAKAILAKVVDRLKPNSGDDHTTINGAVKSTSRRIYQVD